MFKKETKLSEEKPWYNLSTKEQTISFIDKIENNYYQSYKAESEKYEKNNNCYYTWIVLLGFLTSVLLGTKSMLNISNPTYLTFLDLVIFLLPTISSTLLMIVTQRGYKQKEIIRENARIISKSLVYEARIRLSLCKEDKEFADLYLWLNKQIEQIQLNQASGYFTAQQSLLNNESNNDK